MNDQKQNKQEVYHHASKLLSSIGNHQHNVKRDAPGYFFSPENIVAKNELNNKAGTVDLESYFTDKDLKINFLDKEDRKKMEEVISEIILSPSSKSLEETCSKCRKLSATFDDKILLPKA